MKTAGAVDPLKADNTEVPWQRDDKVQRRRRCAQEDVGNNEELRGSAAQRGNQPGCI